MRAAEPSATALDEEALEAWGRRLGRAALEGGVFVALFGPLGAGKSTLVRAACRGAGVEGPVPSPTFTLVHPHRTEGGVIQHVDLYRLSGPEELDGIGWEDLLDHRGAVFVEWADRAGERLPPDRWEVRLRMEAGGTRRGVEARAVGDVPPPPPPEGGDG